MFVPIIVDTGNIVETKAAFHTKQEVTQYLCNFMLAHYKIKINLMQLKLLGQNNKLLVPCKVNPNNIVSVHIQEVFVRPPIDVPLRTSQSVPFNMTQIKEYHFC